MARCLRLFCLVVWALGILTAVSQAEPIALPAEVTYVHAMWGDGQDLLYLVASGKEGALYECRRGAAPRRIDPPGYDFSHRTNLVGTGSGAAAQLVLWDEKGHAAWYREGTWRLAELPWSAGDQDVYCRGVLPGPAQPFSCVAPDGAIATWQDEKLQLVPAPYPGLAIYSATATPEGVIYMIDEKLRLLRFSAGRFETIKRPNLKRTEDDPQDSRPGVWWNQRDTELWVMFSNRMLMWNVKSGRSRVREVDSRLLDNKYPIEWGNVRGVQGRFGPMIWARSYTSRLLCDERACYWIPVTGFLYATFLSASDGIFYASTKKDGIEKPQFESVTIAAPAFGTGPGEPFVPRLQRSVIPFLNVGMGPRWPVPAGDVAFALDVTLGLRRGWLAGDRVVARGFWLTPQLGYSYTPGTHLFVGGLGFGYGSKFAAVDYTPRFVVGNGPTGDRVWGVRHGISGHFVYGMLGVEVAHQYTGEHDVRLMFFINPGLLIVGGIGYLIIGGITSLPRFFYRVFGGR